MFQCILGDQVAVKGFRSLAWEVVAPGPLCAKRGCPSVPMPRVTRDNNLITPLNSRGRVSGMSWQATYIKQVYRAFQLKD